MIFRFLLPLLFLTSAVFAQPTDTVSFMHQLPVIDGKPDAWLASAQLKPFPVLSKSDPANPSTKASYGLAYNARYFYLYLQYPADSVVVRDRGYQNGDGLHMVFARPLAGNAPTREFTVLGFSAGDSYYRKIQWYRNVDLDFRQLGKETQLATACSNGIASFEVLIPWTEVYPFHPWLREMGFNLCFVKAVANGGKNYHLIMYDRNIQNEQSPRKYERLVFEQPDTAVASGYAVLGQNHLQQGSQTVLKILLAGSDHSELPVSVFLLKDDSSLVFRKETAVSSSPGIRRILLPTQQLEPGNYRVVWSLNDSTGTSVPLTILPRLDIAKAMDTLEVVKKRVSEGSYLTLLYRIQAYRENLERLKSYDTASLLLRQGAAWMKTVKECQQGNDVLAHQKGYLRRAFRSGIDSTLQPYSVKIPEGYDGHQKWPLVVFLHGSGDDDREVRVTSFPEKFIVLAPNGRGTSNCFQTEASQTDIAEAIADVCRNYSVDTTRIVLTGFSMGGYGVYRTFWQTPDKFCALVVMSGHPNLAQKWGFNPAPNFLEKRYQSPFRSIPLFIAHGRDDMNCKFSLTQQLVTELKQAGADVTFVEQEGGHRMLSEENRAKLFQWLRRWE